MQQPLTYTNCESEKIAEETGNTENHTYAEVTCTSTNPTRRLNKTNNADIKHKQNIHEKPRSISPTNHDSEDNGTI